MAIKIKAEVVSMWRPISLDYILGRYEPLNIRVIGSLFLWILLIALSIWITLQNLPENWVLLSSDKSELIKFFIINPPLLLCMLLLFWMGFDWAFIPVFLSMFIIGIFSHLEYYWAILFGLSFVFGLSIYAIVYQCLNITYSLRNLMSIVVFVVTSFVASTASSLGAFIWSLSHELSAAETATLWNGWWTGSLLQSVFIIGPILFILSPKVESLKEHWFELPPRKEVSLKWIYSAVMLVTFVIAVFIFSGGYLGKKRVLEEITDVEMSTSDIVTMSLESFEIITWVSIWIVLCVGLGAVFLIGSWNKELVQKVDDRTSSLIKAEKDLMKSLSEKEVLLKEIHHRVKNNLAVVIALLDLQYMNSKDLGVQHVLGDSKSRVKSMAFIHETLYQTDTFSEVDLQEYLGRLCNSIRVTFKSELKDIDVKMNANGSRVEMDKAIPLGLLLNELLVNAFKHAFKGRDKGTINVCLKREDSLLELTVSDDGVGFDEDHTIKMKSKSIGMTIIKTLIRQLKADFEINSSEEGTIFSLKMMVA